MRQMNRRTPKKIIQLVPVCKRDMKAAQSGSRGKTYACEGRKWRRL
ncbi:hypothetical protein QSI_0860 [Clostridioides difficile P28]|nr:hypothetical protein QSI_0860 [Clostridioides difficile P28]